MHQELGANIAQHSGKTSVRRHVAQRFDGEVQTVAELVGEPPAQGGPRFEQCCVEHGNA
jgi:hypothetical protein